MRIEHYPLEQLKRDIVSIVGRYLDISRYRLFFFGSRVTGGGTERSDIDVGIEGDFPVSASVMMKIKDEIEALPTLYIIEVVDFKSVSPDFHEVALSQIEPIQTLS